MYAKVSLLSAVLATFTGWAQAQSFEDVFSAAQGTVGDIEKYQQALQNPDVRLQYALVQQMLKLEDPALQRIAKEHALFSTNPVMREAAVKAILDSGATLRLQMEGTGEAYEKIPDWVIKNGGTFVDKRGEILVTAADAVNDACLGTERHCVFRQVGTTLQFNPFYPGNYKNVINMTTSLSNDGVLRGTMSHQNTEVVQVQIDLKE